MVQAINAIFIQPAFIHTPEPCRIPFNCASHPSQVPSWVDQKHRSASTTTLTGRRIKPIAAGSSPAMVIKIKGDTALLPGKIFLDPLKS